MNFSEAAITISMIEGLRNAVRTQTGSKAVATRRKIKALVSEARAAGLSHPALKG
jgi:hypothetical protein